MSISVSQSQDNILKCLHNKFTVTEEERNQKIVTFKKLESENFEFFLKNITKSDKSIIKTVAD